MRVTVHYLAQIKRAAGVGSETLDVPEGATLHEFLTALAKRHDESFHALLLDDAGRPRRTLLYFVGDTHAPLDAPLCDGAAVSILAPMSGG